MSKLARRDGNGSVHVPLISSAGTNFGTPPTSGTKPYYYNEQGQFFVFFSKLSGYNNFDNGAV